MKIRIAYLIKINPGIKKYYLNNSIPNLNLIASITQFTHRKIRHLNLRSMTKIYSPSIGVAKWQQFPPVVT
jgi:hypothetical protein